MAYLPGDLRIERILRPNGAAELLCLVPQGTGKPIIFDLENSLKREGLCAFIKECEAAQAPLALQASGSLIIPPGLQGRFEFYREFYGLTSWAVFGVEILQAPHDKKDSSEGDSSGIKKVEEPPPPAPKKTAPKTFKKIEALPLRTVPAGIVWIADSKKPSGPKPGSPSKPQPLSEKLGGHRVGFSRVGLGMPAAGLKSLGGFGGIRR